MARTALTVVASAFAGTALGLTAADVGNGNSFSNSSGKTYCHLRNTNSGSTARTATFKAQTTTRPADSQFPSQAVADLVVSVAAAGEKVVGPIPAAYVKSDGTVEVDGSHAELLISPFSVSQG